MEVAGLRTPLNEEAEYSAYADKMEKLGKPYEEGDDGYAKAVEKYLKENSTTIKQAIASKLANSKITGELAVSKDEFANYLLHWSYLANKAKLVGATTNFLPQHSSQGISGRKIADEWAKKYSKAGLKSWLTDDYWGYNDYKSQLNDKLDLDYTLKKIKNDPSKQVWWGDAHSTLFLYLINTQGGSEASTWALDGLNWLPDLEKLVEAKGEQAATELMKAVEAGFDAWVDLVMNDNFDKLIAQTQPKPQGGGGGAVGAIAQVSGKQAKEELKKDATLKGEFEKWLVDTLETGGATKEDLAADFGHGMKLDPDDLDMDDIVSNIIGNKKYSDDLGEFFSDYKGGLNESIHEQMLRVKKQLWK